MSETTLTPSMEEEIIVACRNWVRKLRVENATDRRLMSVLRRPGACSLLLRAFRAGVQFERNRK